MANLGNPKNTIEIIQKYEFMFQKKFGQNFLIDAHVLEKIISAAGITKDDCVLEIGPGIGTMTQYLAENAGHVVAVEIDRNLIPILKETLADYDNVTVINEDILRVDIKALAEEYNGGKPIKVVANLPYYITTPIIMGLFESGVPIDNITVMVQKEVADRMKEGPGSKDYGALSLAVQYYAEPEIVANVPPNCFIPRPNVGSAVIRLTRHKEMPVEVKDPALMFKIIRASFNQRRKTLQNGLGNAPELPYTKEQIAAAIAEMGLTPTIRGEAIDLDRLGAVVTKGIANVPWPGNPTPRVTEVYGGMLNAIGLQGPGVDVFMKRDVPFLRQHDTKIIVNVCGKSESDYVDVVERLADADVDMLEINISCPNVKEGGIAFGQDPKCAEQITKAVKKVAKQPVIMKLSPNVTDIAEMARAVEAGGADVVSLINTITGMKIDINKRTFALANKTGGMSGPAIKPVAVRMVYQVANAVKIPVIGMGGIMTAEDALEFILAGGTAVYIGTASFINPDTTIQVIEGIEAYMKKYGVEDIHELIGAVH